MRAPIFLFVQGSAACTMVCTETPDIECLSQSVSHLEACLRGELANDAVDG